MGYTKYCEASSSSGNFTCYGLADSTNFDLFIQQAENSQLVCNSGEYDETDYPAYSYSAVMSKRNDTYSYTINQEGFIDTQEFNKTKALTGTMSSNFEIQPDAPTSSPTNSPTNSPTEPPTESSSANNIGMEGLLSMVFVFVLGLMF